MKIEINLISRNIRTNKLNPLITMKKILIVFFSFIAIIASAQNPDSIMIRSIFKEALRNGKGYEWLDHLSNKIGGRLSGSPQAAKAVEYTKSVLDSLQAAKVFLQECKVPHWVRGEKEQAYLIDESTGKRNELTICALGGSIATPEKGITAPVVEVRSWDELDKLGKESVSGKIVFYNTPMSPDFYSTFQAYGTSVGYRWAGAARAAKYGAVATIVRSMTLALDDFPHTGSMGYNDTIPKIPACAISTLDAEMLSKQLMKKNSTPKVFLKMSCEKLPDATSYNVVAEIKGSTHPEEIICFGGHLDAWDNGDGAHDDGAGCVQAMEVIRIFKALGIMPKRTIRAVLWMNEENGGRGGAKYAEEAKAKNENHIAAIESDAGGFTPKGFTMETEGDKSRLDKIRSWKNLFLPWGLYDWDRAGSGADIDHLRSHGTVLISLSPDSQRYFDYHHAPSDTYDKVNKRELHLGAASIAALVWMISEYGLQ